ncbi:MAG: trans-aconitate 2-methyltransferase [Pyrinomonadaceae bacterium]
MTFRHYVRKIIPTPFRSFLGGLRRKVIANPLRVRLQRDRLLKSSALSATQRALLQQVNINLHYRDGMYAGNGEHYFRVGLSALECIEKVIANVDSIDIENVLDLPCGYGRELRFMVQQFPQTSFTACDIQRDAVDFCARTFGADAAYSDPDIRKVSFPRKFDLIWCGSLVTHLNRRDAGNLLKLFSDHLNPNGVVIVTTHGSFVAGRMQAGANYDLPRAAITSLLQEYEATGYGYHDYSPGEGFFDFHPCGTGYGISLTSPDSICSLAEKSGLKHQCFLARGWANHQDVFAFTRSS